jgi:hypothetical protein
MNRENPRSPPNPRSYFCGFADAHQRFSKSVPTSGTGAGFKRKQITSQTNTEIVEQLYW